MVLARNSVLLCDDRELSWEDLADAVALWQRAKSKHSDAASKLYQVTLGTYIPLPVERLQTYAERILDLCRLWTQARAAESEIGLENLVVSLSWMQNSVHKDAIYAFINLARGFRKDALWEWQGMSLPEPWIINYNLSDTTIFMRFIAQCIRVSGSLDVLCRSWAPDTNDNLPSWIKKAQQRRSKQFSVLVDFVGLPGQENKFYCAAGSTYPSYRFSSSSTVGSQVNDLSQRLRALLPFRAPLLERLGDLGRVSHFHSLFVEGFRLGEIRRISPRVSRGLITRECLELGGFHSPGPEGRWDPEIVPLKLWRTLVADRTATGERPPPWYPRAFLACLEKCVERTEGDLIAHHDDDTGGHDAPAAILELYSRIRDVTWNRKLFRGKDDLLGLVPADARVGDLICILFGCSVPVVLRASRLKSLDSFYLVGECFAYGYMDGEAITGPHAKKFAKTRQDFRLR